MCVIRAKCSIHRNIARNVTTSVIRYSTNFSNMAIYDKLEKHEDLLRKIKDLMIKLKTLFLSAKLLNPAGFRVRTRNKKRWCSAFEMLWGFRKVCDHICLLGSEYVDGLPFNTAEDCRENQMLERSQNLNSIT